jgi:hypothetical protein
VKKVMLALLRWCSDNGDGGDNVGGSGGSDANGGDSGGDLIFMAV